VLKAGRKIERTQGRPRSSVQEADLHAVVDELRLARQTLRSLRAWGLDTLAGALDA
jgi:hypothetical protein